MAVWIKNLPFLNRKRYIVLKAYTRNSAYLEHAPIKVGSKECPVKNTNTDDGHKSFASCYGRLAGLSRSATVEIPTALTMTGDADGNVTHDYADTKSVDFAVSYDHIGDSSYGAKDVVVTKIVLPWMLQEETGVDFVVSRHIRNTSPMIVPTGVASYKLQHSINVFNCIPRVDIKYNLSLGDKLVSLFPLSDKKLIVESYYDPLKFVELQDRSQYNPYVKGSVLKLQKRQQRLVKGHDNGH